MIGAALAAAVDPVNLLGALGVACGALWALLTGRAAILACQATGAVAFASHYYLLGSTTGAALCLVAVVQSVASASLGRRPGLLGAIFAVSALAVLVAAWQSWAGAASAFAATGSACATLGRLQRREQRMRLAFLGCSLAWVGHNLLMRSGFGLVCDALTLAGIGLGLWRHRRRPVAAALPSAPPEPANDRGPVARRRVA